MRKLSPGGYEYLTHSTACADRELLPGEDLADYLWAHGYQPGYWQGTGAEALGVSGVASAEQIQALFGEGRHPDATTMEADAIEAGESVATAMAGTQLGRRFPRYSTGDPAAEAVREAYQEHNRAQGLPLSAPIDAVERERIRADVHGKLFAAAHEGRPPADAQELRGWLHSRAGQGKTPVAGYEFVMAPPKSVSVAWALGSPETRQMIQDAHTAAVAETVTFFEKNAAFTRAGANGEAQVDTNGVTAAAFLHWDSRCGDPHLHTHVIVSSKVQRATDGRWTSLDGRPVFAATVTLSEVYNAQIRDRLRAYNADFTARFPSAEKRPVYELDGVPQDLLQGFSQRARQVERARAAGIVAFRAEHGREPGAREVWEISRRAQYATRPGKQPPRTLGEHLARWHEHAVDLADPSTWQGLDQRIFGPTQLADVVSDDDINAAAGAVVEVVSEHRAHFTAWHLTNEAHRQTAHLTVAPQDRETVVDAVVARVLRSPATVALAAPPTVAVPESLRRGSGESVFTQHNATAYTTTETLREEQELIVAARLTGGYRLREADIQTAVAAAGLNAGQARMVVGFARSGLRVQQALAPAGAGKTTAMRVLATSWRDAGGRVFAFGPSARAAQELAGAIGARPHTLHQLTTCLNLGIAERAFGLRPGDLVLVDEMSMAGRHTLHRVVHHALQAGADVRLIGDTAQVDSVEASGIAALIDTEVGSIHFGDVVRFRDPAQAAASLQIRDGDPQGLDYYLDNDRVLGGSVESIRHDALTAWRGDVAAGAHTLLIVSTREDVTALNVEAQAHRVQAGQVTLQRTARLRDHTEAGVGDWVVTRRNSRHLRVHAGRDFVKNGDTWSVEKVHRDGSLRVRHNIHHARVRLPVDYVAGHVELAYAATVHRVEGMTTRDSAHTLVPAGMTRQQLYPAVTRSAGSNYLYVETHHHVADSHQETPNPATPREVLAGVLAHDDAEISATEYLRRALTEAESLHTLVAQYTTAAQWGAEHRYHQLLTDRAPIVLRTDASPAVFTVLRHAEDRGYQAERLLSTRALRGLDTAADPAALLAARLRRASTGTPPPRELVPTAEDVAGWQSLVDPHRDWSAEPAERWAGLWRRVAAAHADGYDTTPGLRMVAARLTGTPPQSPYPAAQAAPDLFTLRTSTQRTVPAVPWLPRAHPGLLAADPDMARYLTELNTAISVRRTELLSTVTGPTTMAPAWTRELGARPTDQVAARAWDELVGDIAAFRETRGLTTTPADTGDHAVLGDELTGDSLLATAQRALHHRIHNSIAGLVPGDGESVLAGGTRALVSWVDEPEEFDHLDQLDTSTSLAGLVAEHNTALRAPVDEHLHRVVAATLPGALSSPALPWLLGTLRAAHHTGHDTRALLTDILHQHRLEHIEDPTAVVNYYLRQHTTNTAPAARTGLPWVHLPPPDFAETHPRLASRVDHLAWQINDTHTQLREHAAWEQPDWTTGIGPRPTTNPQAAARWDHLAGTAAAYQQTYGITPTPDAPLGPEPTHGARAYAYRTITQHWRPAMPTPDENYASTGQLAIERLRAARERNLAAEQQRREQSTARPSAAETQRYSDYRDYALYEADETRDTGHTLGY